MVTLSNAVCVVRDQSCVRTKFSVAFRLLEKVLVNGPDTHPLYRQLKRARRGLLGTSRIQWNFNKFLVARDGTVLARYGSNRRPEDLEHDIENQRNWNELVMKVQDIN